MILSGEISFKSKNFFSMCQQTLKIHQHWSNKNALPEMENERGFNESYDSVKHYAPTREP